MVNVRIKFKALRFDDRRVLAMVDKRERKVLSKFGAFVRQTARRSIRRRKGASKPGKPPSSHSGLLKRFIFFGYEPNKRNVVIGPARLTGRNRGEATHLSEYGGSGTVLSHGNRRRAKYPARPFMRPAFEQEKKQLPKLWRDSIS